MSAEVASVSIGRKRLPPEEIRWFATSGIMVTSEPVRLDDQAVDPLKIGAHEDVEPLDRGLRLLERQNDSHLMIS